MNDQQATTSQNYQESMNGQYIPDHDIHDYGQFDSVEFNQK